MSRACTRSRVTFDKFHVIAHASAALDHTRRLEQKTDPSLKGLRWTLLKDRDRLSAANRAALIAHTASKRTARAWLYCEHLRAILDRKQINVVTAMLRQWCTREPPTQPRRGDEPEHQNVAEARVGR